jgi:hypothetical protein
MTVQVASLNPIPFDGSRRTGLKTVVTGTASRFEVMADWLEFAAEAAAAVVVPAMRLVETRTAAAVELARLVVAPAPGTADVAAYSGGQG